MPTGDLEQPATGDWSRVDKPLGIDEDRPRESDSVVTTPVFLPSASQVRNEVVIDLIKFDLQVRWRRGQGIPLEAYLVQFPQMGSVQAFPPQLIYEEYRVRHLYGDQPSLAGYRERFPGQFAELRLLAEQGSSTARAPLADYVGDARELVGPGDKHYRLLERIGQGSFGEVYRGEAPGGIPVAVKRIIKPIDQVEAQRELRSLELIKTLRHPFLLSTHAFWLSGDRLYIVMDLADRSLRDRLREQPGRVGLPTDELVTYMTQAAQALDYLHGQNVLHRDVKPGNILLLGGYVKLGDFGLAHQLLAEDMFSTGCGTPHYMAPEVRLGSASRRSDQYSLAVTYAELRLGRLPFSGQNAAEVMKDHLEHAPNLASLPEAEQQVLYLALEKDPGRRYDSCQEFVQALCTALAPKPAPQWSSPPTSDFLGQVLQRPEQREQNPPLPAPPAPARIHALLKFVAVILLLTLTIPGLLWWATRKPDQRDTQNPANRVGGGETTREEVGGGEKDPRGPHDLPQCLEELIQKVQRNRCSDFDLDVKIKDSQPDDTDTYQLKDKQKVIFEVKVGENADIAIMTFAPNVDPTIIFPNEAERGEILPAKELRTLPNESVIRTEASKETEWVYVIASTKRLPELKEGKRDGGFLVLQTLEERQKFLGLERTMKAGPRPAKFAERLLRYRVN